MNKFMSIIVICLIPVLAPAQSPQSSAEIENWWKTGHTLPVETSANYPQESLRMKNDTGINVLIDMAHKCDFFLLWSLPGQLHSRGYRAVGSHASLDSVLPPGSKCRVRVPVADKILPFGWIPAPQFNVVITEGRPGYPEYIKAEATALMQFVQSGGGLIICGAPLKNESEAASWSLNQFLKMIGAEVLPGRESYLNANWPVLKTDNNWEVTLQGISQKPVIARRPVGKGRIMLLASADLYRYDKKNQEDIRQKCDFLSSAINWVSTGKSPVGGDTRLPVARGGGGGIYPESELSFDGIVCFYSKNQLPDLLQTARVDFPAITKDIYAWLPSEKPQEPMYLILCSGGGGGWAVNAYLPKEASTISTSSSGIRSIFAHEQAHTMAGPCSVARHPFGGNRGEEHAGWFQGKIIARYNGDTGPNRQCQKVFRKDYDPASPPSDPARIFNAANLEKWQTGHDRMMIWFVWQKLDDRYGPTWYPRWRWIQQLRWQNDPDHDLTWEESITDMSIAVGEDLFPFFAKTGKNLSIKRLESIPFNGKTIILPIAPLEPTLPGNVNLDPIGDYRKAIVVSR